MASLCEKTETRLPHPHLPPHVTNGWKLQLVICNEKKAAKYSARAEKARTASWNCGMEHYAMGMVCDSVAAPYA